MCAGRTCFQTCATWQHCVVADVSWGALVLSILGTGTVSGAVAQLLTNRGQTTRQLQDQAYTQAMQRDARAHDQRLRIEQAHSLARDAFLEDVANTEEWIRWKMGEVHGHEVDWYPEYEP